MLHKDHSISIPKAIRYCLDVFSCQEVQSVHSSVKVLRKGVKTQIGGFRVQPFPLYHSAECIGFVIETPDKQKIVFATDTNKIPYRFKGVNHFIVECNNNFDDMVDNLCDNNVSMSNSKDHMEISDTIEFLKQNYSSDLQSVTLIHLSDANIDAKKALERVKEELGFDRVWIAEKGLEIELEKEEF